MKANSALFLFTMIVSLDLFGASYQINWSLQGNHGETSITTDVNCNQGALIINHHFISNFSFSSLMDGEANINIDSYFWDLVNSPTHLSITGSNQVTIQYDENFATTQNLFALMHSQIESPNSIDQSSINGFPVSAGLVPIPFLPASSEYLDGATVASISSDHNSVNITLSFVEELQCENCYTGLTLTQSNEDFIFTIHHSGSLKGKPHQFTLSTHISGELMSVLINGENATIAHSDLSIVVSGIGALLLSGSHITSGSK